MYKAGQASVLTHLKLVRVAVVKRDLSSQAECGDDNQVNDDEDADCAIRKD